MRGGASEAVLLGFVGDPVAQTHENDRGEVSIIGGAPRWLAGYLPENICLNCRKCGQPLVFLCQLSTPYDSCHRVLYLFECVSAEGCCREGTGWLALRATLPSTLQQKELPLSSPPPPPAAAATASETLSGAAAHAAACTAADAAAGAAAVAGAGGASGEASSRSAAAAAGGAVPAAGDAAASVTPAAGAAAASNLPTAAAVALDPSAAVAGAALARATPAAASTGTVADASDVATSRSAAAAAEVSAAASAAAFRPVADGGLAQCSRQLPLAAAAAAATPEQGEEVVDTSATAVAQEESRTSRRSSFSCFPSPSLAKEEPRIHCPWEEQKNDLKDGSSLSSSSRTNQELFTSATACESERGWTHSSPVHERKKENDFSRISAAADSPRTSPAQDALSKRSSSSPSASFSRHSSCFSSSASSSSSCSFSSSSPSSSSSSPSSSFYSSSSASTPPAASSVSSFSSSFSVSRSYSSSSSSAAASYSAPPTSVENAVSPGAGEFFCDGEHATAAAGAGGGDWLAAAFSLGFTDGQHAPARTGRSAPEAARPAASTAAAAAPTAAPEAAAGNAKSSPQQLQNQQQRARRGTKRTDKQTQQQNREPSPGPSASSSNTSSVHSAEERRNAYEKTSLLTVTSFHIYVDAEPADESVYQKRLEERALALWKSYTSRETDGTLSKEEDFDRAFTGGGAFEAEPYEASPYKVLLKFQQRLSRSPRQVIRYCFGGQPLWLHAPSANARSIPLCERCGSERVFEMQLMPTLPYELQQKLRLAGENSFWTAEGPSWGVVVVYTCAADCTRSDFYAEECVVVQEEV